MNRRELLQLGATAVGALPLAAAAGSGLPSDTWHLRIQRAASTLAPGMTSTGLCTELVSPGAVGRDVPVRVHNASARPVTLRSTWWDRDLSLAAGAEAGCRMDLRHGRAAVCLDDGYTRTRTLLGPGTAATGAVEAEYALAIHHWRLDGLDATPHRATLGPQVLAASDPLPVRTGQRVRFRFFNASALWPVSLHLPGHEFEVQAVDDMPLRSAVGVIHLDLAPGERVDAHVMMQRPGRWVLGSLSRREQQAGFGRVIEYAGARGTAIASLPRPVHFDHTRLSLPGDPHEAGAPAVIREVVLDTDQWDRRALRSQPGRLERLVFSNMTPSVQVVALRGHRVELRQSGNEHVHGLYKDTLALRPFARVAVHCVARGSELALLRL